MVSPLDDVVNRPYLLMLALADKQGAESLYWSSPLFEGNLGGSTRIGVSSWSSGIKAEMELELELEFECRPEQLLIRTAARAHARPQR